ncbi:hypothetical protein AALO_G00206450 [Alosa alosa]|uniref:CHRD domain-containing protein n=1 Tax=Alosa alosa TaxID=278164 RepID=A0AAV6G3V5_9TELE|nr:hypothetical protein AALO_G00206450 [Alosa alosa]
MPGTLTHQVVVVAGQRVITRTLELVHGGTEQASRSVPLSEGWGAESGKGRGSVGRLEARHIHMLLQNELFINVATEMHADGELRGQVVSLPYSGLEALTQELPVPLAGQLVTPPVASSAGGHAWVALDERCHLHYEIIVSGLSRSDDLTVNAHLHGLAEIGEMDESSPSQRRLLTGFYGSQVHVPNSCEFGSRGAVVEEAEFDELVFVRDPEELRKDPLTCFFEGEHHTHGSHWTPQYNACFNCSCQKRTVI